MNETTDVSLLELLSILLRHWRMLLITPIVFAIVVGSRSLLQERTYAASATFMPEITDGRGSSAAASLARQFGVSLGGSRPGQSPQFYADVLRSREILRRAVESEYTDSEAVGRNRTFTLIEIYGLDEQGGVPAWRVAVERLRRSTSISVERETGVVALRVSSNDGRLAEQIAARFLELLNEFNLETRQSQAREEGRFVAERLADARAELAEVEAALQLFLQQNRQFRNSPELVFEHERLQRQVAMRQEIFSSLMQAREQARLDAVRDTPVFTVIDHPAESAHPVPRGTVLRTILALVFGVIAASFVAFVLDVARRGPNQPRDGYREFNDLKKQTLHDLRSPARWFRPARTKVAAGDY